MTNELEMILEFTINILINLMIELFFGSKLSKKSLKYSKLKLKFD